MGRGGGSSSGSGGGSGHFNYGNSRGGGNSSSHSHSSGGYNYRRSRYYHYPMSTAQTVLVVVILFAMVIIQFGTFAYSRATAIQKSTIEREVLPSDMCMPIDTWFQDEMTEPWIFNESEVEKGLKHFYKKTGVQPFLWVTDNINGKAKPTESDFEVAMLAKYSSLFKDQGHVLVCFMESSPSVYATYYWAGSDAERVIDSEAGEIILDTLDYYYSDGDLTDEEFFAKSFKESADRIMKVNTTTKQYMIIAICIVGIAVAVIAIFFVVKKHKEALEEERKILDTDIDEMADSVLEKYNKEG